MTVSSSNYPNRPFRLEERTAILDQVDWDEGNASLVRSELLIIKNSYSPTYDFSGTSNYGMYIKGTLVGTGSFSYDFRNSDWLLLHQSDNWFAHDSEGHMAYAIDGYSTAAILGTTSVHNTGYAPRIAQPALGPTPLGLDNITANSMRYMFSGNDLRGGSLIRWEFQHANNSSFTGATMVTSSGTSTITGLPPGALRYFRSRAVTNAGNGAWSTTISAATLSSVKLSVDGAWATPQIVVSDGTTWLSPEVLVSSGGAWVAPAQ